MVDTLPRTPRIKMMVYTTDIGTMVKRGKCWAPRWLAM